MISRIGATIWKMLRGQVQWYVLWIAHAKFIIGVCGVVFDDQGRVLLLRHRYWRANSWGLPSGYAVRREELEASLAREVREETGLVIEGTELLRVKGGFKLRIEIAFTAHITGGTLVIDPAEVLAAQFFEVDQLPEGLLETHRELVRLAVARTCIDVAANDAERESSGAVTRQSAR